MPDAVVVRPAVPVAERVTVWVRPPEKKLETPAVATGSGLRRSGPAPVVTVRTDHRGY